MRTAGLESQEGILAATVDRILGRLVRSEGSPTDVLRQEAARAGLPLSMLEAVLRLDPRFIMTSAGWQVRVPPDRWSDFALALSRRKADTPGAYDLLRQIIVGMNAATRSRFSQYYSETPSLPDRLLEQVVACVEAHPSEDFALLKGPIFDLTMSHLFDNAEKNRFFTPRSITQFVAAWARPQPGEQIIDPCYGSGGFLLAMAQELQHGLQQSHVLVKDRSTLFETSLQFHMDLGEGAGSHMQAVVDRMLHGMDRDEAAAWSGKTNVDLHGFGGSHLQQADALDLEHGAPLESFDVVAGNPPFGDKVVAPIILEQFELGRDPKSRPLGQQVSEVLFLEGFLRLAKPGARVAILLPDGILANVGEQRIRDYLFRQALVDAVIALPRRVFRNDAKSNVLLLRKKLTPEQSQERLVFLASVQDIRTELDDVLRRLSTGPAAP